MNSPAPQQQPAQAAGHEVSAESLAKAESYIERSDPGAARFFAEKGVKLN